MAHIFHLLIRINYSLLGICFVPLSVYTYSGILVCIVFQLSSYLINFTICHLGPQIGKADGNANMWCSLAKECASHFFSATEDVEIEYS